jgi:hypothetical protein
MQWGKLDILAFGDVNNAWVILRLGSESGCYTGFAHFV